MTVAEKDVLVDDACFRKPPLADYDPRPKLANDTAPMFLVLGRYDYAVPYDLWNGLEEKIPHLTRHLFEQSSHFPMLEESAAFDDRLIRWLAKVR